MAASKPTSWLFMQFHILYHLSLIRDLRWRSGLFPSRQWHLAVTVRLPRKYWKVFEVFLGSVLWLKALAQKELYPSPGILEASPKAISRRTSYRRVRLEFLPYTQLIPWSCNISGSGPPPEFNRDSTWPCIAHPASGLVHETNFALFRLAFTTAPPMTGLT